MSKPVFIEPLVTKDVGDCTIACLVMWTGKPYPEVIAAAPPNAHKRGMFTKDIIETAAKLGTVFKRRRKFDLHEDDGILTVLPDPTKKGRPDHAVVLINGAVLDPFNGRLWLEVETYLRTEQFRIGTLLMEEEG